ncbi:MAG TPA: SCO1664 family protein [Candidatus Dormibacteraeota bacterium]
MPDRSSDSSTESTERLLTQLPEMRLAGVLHGASNYTFLATLAPHPPTGLEVVYKPARGESPLWDFEAGTLYKREVAAYRLSKVFGWPSIPPTVIRRRAPHGVGMVQLYIDADNRHFLSEQTSFRDAWLRVALFDVITNNADRKSGHCLFDSENHVWVIDHGLTFHTEHKLRTVIWDFAGEALPGDLCGDVERALASLQAGELSRALERLLSPAEVDMLGRRLRGVLDPQWRFPEPTSAWSIPWPPI